MNRHLVLVVTVLCSMLMPITSCAREESTVCETAYLFNERSSESSIPVNIKKNRVKEYIKTIHGAKPPKANQAFFISVVSPNEYMGKSFADVLDIWVIPNYGEVSEDAECEEVLGEPEKTTCGYSLNDEVSAAVVFDKTRLSHQSPEYEERTQVLATEIKKNVLCKVSG